MDLDFTIQKEPKKTVEISANDIDDINLDELQNMDLDVSDDSSLHFFKAGSKPDDRAPKPDFFGKDSPLDKRNSPVKSKINVKKNDAHLPPTIKRNSPNRHVVEPDSQDLGLDMIVNQKKKIINNQDDERSLSTVVSKSSKSSRSSKRSLNLDVDRVKNIMDEKSESTRASKKEADNISLGSVLSDKIKEKVKQKTHANESERKQELLFLFDKLEKKGVKIPQKFSMRSPIDDMEKTYERLKNERDLQNSIKFQRRVLMGLVSTMEFLNHSMNPFDIDLDGWSESVMENYSEYDDIFEELYEKYKNRGQISPEVKLMMTLAGSAFYFHLSKMIIKPVEAKMKDIFGEMEAGGGIGGGGGGMGGGGGGMGFMSGLMNNFMGGGGGGGGRSRPSNDGGMKGPQGFDDILSKGDSDIPSVQSSVSAGKKRSRTLNM